MRIIIYTGKGGVGKTSVAAAAGMAAAQKGLRTLVMSTDAAHSLGDSYGRELGHEPVEVAPKLWALEVNAYNDLEENWGVVREHISRLVALQGMDEVLADEAAILPGMDELFSLARLKSLAASGNYDCIIVDAASTGETLRLLALPQTLSWSVKVLKRADRYILKPIVRPLASLSPGLEEMIAPEEVFEALERMLAKLKAIRKLLSDASVTSVRLVMNPEKMVIQESKRALTYFNMYGLQVDAVIVNRVLQHEAGYLEHWRDLQMGYLEEVERSFAPLPILKSPFYPTEVVGLEALEQLSGDLFGTVDPTALMYCGRVFEIRKQQGEYLLRLRLPALEKERLRIRSTGTELVLQLDNQRRIISLPSAMAGYRPARAHYDEGTLQIHFRRRVTE